MARKRLKSVEAVVEHLGGKHAVAKLTKRSCQNVNNWFAIGTFSATTYLVITTALAESGATASPKLWRMEGNFNRAA